MKRVLALTVVLLSAGCKGGPDDAAPAAANLSTTLAPASGELSPNRFLARGTPTFITGTRGDDAADRAIRAQIELIRQMFFPGAAVLDDDALTHDNWPDNPVVYGGPHVNTLMNRLAPGLPFELGRGHLKLGEHTLRGEDLQIITVVPARAEPPAHPELLLYAGTGSPGVAEINAVTRGDDPIVVADAFGPLIVGRWQTSPDGAVTPALEPPRTRIQWRDIARPGVTLSFPADIAAARTESELIASAERGLATALEQLALAAPEPSLRFYVYPSVEAKQALTGNAGDGHAVVSARALHIIGRDNTSRIAALVAHEATHVLAYDAFGPPGTPLMAEGLAVWVSGGYGGGTLAQWRERLAGRPRPTARELLGPAFRKSSERLSYPLAGLLVEGAVRIVGRDAVVRHLLGATAATWDDACKRAGTTPEAIEGTLP